ncbi:hypothetical protein [Roseibium album]|uniref:hypothetical protein n=1 Tax=Roseibium album TaxID=311410 RepID=UPI003BB04ADD
MISAGKDKQNAGKFAYEIFIDNELVLRKGGFDCAQERDRDAETEHRRRLFPQPKSQSTPELMAELDELAKLLGIE